MTGAGVAAATFSGWARAAVTETPPRLLILIELRGGNDGRHTVVLIEDGRYYDLRPRLALRGDAVVPLGPGAALPWIARAVAAVGREEMAVLRKSAWLPAARFSHFRSIEIWDTASSSREIVQTGWLTRRGDLGSLQGGICRRSHPRCGGPWPLLPVARMPSRWRTRSNDFRTSRAWPPVNAWRSTCAHRAGGNDAGRRR